MNVTLARLIRTAPILVGSVALSSLTGCGWLGKGSGLLTSQIAPLAKIEEKAQIASPSAVQALQAGTVAIGSSISTELNTNLVGAGLTQAQADVVTTSSNQSVLAAAGTISISPSLALTDSDKPLLLAAGPVVTGAFAALNLPDVGLSDSTRRAAIAKVIMNSTFSSLSGRVDNLTDDELSSLHSGMVGSAVQTLSKAGLAGANSSAALTAVTSGAVEALSKSVSSANAAAAAGQIITGAVSNMNSDGLPAASLQTMMSAATMGVVGGLQKAGVASSDIVAAASSVAKASITGLKGLSLSVDNLLKATSGAATGAVGGLTNAGVSQDQVAAAASKVASSSVAALQDAGFANSHIASAAGAVASGAIQGLGAAGLSAAQIISSNSISSIVSGTSGGLAAAGVSPGNIGYAIGTVAASAVGAIANTSLASGDPALKTLFVSQIVTGSAAGVARSGLTSGAALSAMTSISQQSVQALPGAGFTAAQASVASATVVGVGISQSVAAGLTTAANASTLASALGAAVGAACANANITVDANTMLTAVSNAATAVGASDVATMMTSAMSGTASGAALASNGAGSNAVLASLTASINSGAAFAGLSSSINQNSLAGSLTQAVTSSAALASTVQSGGLPVCGTTFSNKLSDSDFWTAVKGATQPVICQATAAGGCPVARSAASPQAIWSLIGATGDCQLLIQTSSTTAGTTGAAGALIPACSQLATKTTVSLLSPYFNAAFNGVPCSKTTAASCPALPTDADSGFSWSVSTITTANDTCILKDQVTVASNGSIVACSTIGAVAQSNAAPIFDFSALGLFSTSTSQGPQNLLCSVAVSDPCPVPAQGISNLIQGPNRYPQGSTYVCQYYNQAPACSTLFSKSATVLASQLSSSPAANDLGDVNCSVAVGSTCPILSDSGYSFAADDSSPLLRVCDYTATYAACNGLQSTNIDTTAFAQLQPGRRNAGVRACDATGTAVTAKLDPTLVAAGFEAPVTWRSWSNQRMVVRTNSVACATLFTGNFTADILNQLPNFGITLASGCDVGPATSCPALAPSLSGDTLVALSVPALGVTRCMVSATLPVCPTTVGTADLSTFPSALDNNNRSYGCTTTTSCPSSETLLNASFTNSTLSLTTSNVQRCVYTATYPLCDDVDSNNLISNVSQLGMIPTSKYSRACDLKIGEASCPNLSPSLNSNSLTSALIYGTNTTRCFVQPTAVACSLVGSTITPTTLPSLTAETWQGGNTSASACISPSLTSCPYVITSLQSSLSLNATTLPDGRYLCEYQPLTGTGTGLAGGTTTGGGLGGGMSQPNCSVVAGMSTPAFSAYKTSYPSGPFCMNTGMPCTSFGGNLTGLPLQLDTMNPNYCDLTNSSVPGPAVVAGCQDIGAGGLFNFNTLMQMTPDPMNPQIVYCDTLSANTCFSPIPALANVVNAPLLYPNGAYNRCSYQMYQPICQNAFPGLALTLPSLESATDVNELGDVQCVTNAPNISGCPTDPDVGTYVASGDLTNFANAGYTICNYNRVYADCSTLGTTALASTDLARLQVAPGNANLRACTLSSAQTYTYTGDLLSAGLAPPQQWGYANGTRLIFQMDGVPCASLTNGNMSAALLSKLQTLPTVWGQACDLPSAVTVCPPRDSSLAGALMSEVPLPSLGINRCIYSAALPACATTDSALDPSFLATAQALDAPPTRAYGCDNGSNACPALPTAMGAAGYQMTPVSTAGHERCFAQTSTPLCSDVSVNNLINNFQGFGNASASWTCDIPSAAPSCPALNATMAGIYTPSGRYPVAGVPFSRCYFQNAVTSCDQLAGAATDAGILSLTYESWLNGGNNPTYGCDTSAGLCPTPVNGASYALSSTTLPDGMRSHCDYSHVSNIGSFVIQSPPISSMNPQPFAQWSPASGATGYHVTVSHFLGCNNDVFDLAQTGTGVLLPNLNYGTYYLCVTATENGASPRIAMNNPYMFSVGTVPDANASTISGPTSLASGTNTQLVLTTRDNNNVLITHGGNNIVFFVVSGNGSVSQAADAGNGQYIVNFTAGPPGTVIIAARINDGAMIPPFTMTVVPAS